MSIVLLHTKYFHRKTVVISREAQAHVPIEMISTSWRPLECPMFWRWLVTCALKEPSARYSVSLKMITNFKNLIWDKNKHKNLSVNHSITYNLSGDNKLILLQKIFSEDYFLLVFKSDGQEKSTKILISWQELKNQFLSFFVHR